LDPGRPVPQRWKRQVESDLARRRSTMSAILSPPSQPLLQRRTMRVLVAAQLLGASGLAAGGTPAGCWPSA
jgi:hypothetical protein